MRTSPIPGYFSHQIPQQYTSQPVTNKGILCRPLPGWPRSAPTVGCEVSPGVLVTGPSLPALCPTPPYAEQPPSFCPKDGIMTDIFERIRLNNRYVGKCMSCYNQKEHRVTEPSQILLPETLNGPMHFGGPSENV